MIQSDWGAATRFSIEYVHVLSDTLGFQIGLHGMPIDPVEGTVDPRTFRLLRQKMRDLLSSSLSRDAVYEIGSTDHGDRTLAVAFGQVSDADFHRMVKLGLLVEDRVVLWEYMWDAFLRRSLDDGQLPHPDLLRVASNIVALEPVLRAGVIAIVPHPSTWSGAAQSALSDFDLRAGQFESAYERDYTQGLAVAIAVVNGEKIPLHPYALLRKPADQLEATDLDVYTKLKQYLHENLGRLFLEESFPILDDLSIGGFYEVLTDGTFAVRDKLTGVRQGLPKILREVFANPPHYSSIERSVETARLINAMKEYSAYLHHDRLTRFREALLIEGKRSLMESLTTIIRSPGDVRSVLGAVRYALGFSPFFVSLLGAAVSSQDAPVVLRFVRQANIVLGKEQRWYRSPQPQ